MRTIVFLACVLTLASCGSRTGEPSREAQAPQAEPSPLPSDESRRFPQANLVSSEVVATALAGKPFMPGGTLARYRRGRTEYRMFVARAASATDAAIKLNDWRAALKNPEFVASFGGYFGDDGGIPVFVFTKGEWIAGVLGLPRIQADAAARPLAIRL